jgi:hypothetical protein
MLLPQQVTIVKDADSSLASGTSRVDQSSTPADLRLGYENASSKHHAFFNRLCRFYVFDSRIADSWIASTSKSRVMALCQRPPWTTLTGVIVMDLCWMQ